MDWITLSEFVQQNLLPILAALVLSQFIILVLLIVLWSRNRRSKPVAVQDNTSQLDELENMLESLQAEQAALQARQASAIQYVGFCRYNAFPDTGGELSFSLALLNGEKEGFVLTSLYGRQDARVYAKPVKADSSPVRLSPEEQEAIRQAIYSKN